MIHGGAGGAKPGHHGAPVVYNGFKTRGAPAVRRGGAGRVKRRHHECTLEAPVELSEASKVRCGGRGGTSQGHSCNIVAARIFELRCFTTGRRCS